MKRYYVEPNSAAKGFPIIEGLPDVGLVGTITTSYLISQLESKTVGHIEIEDLPPVVTVYRSKIYEPCRLHLCNAGNGKQISVLYSDVPIPPSGLRSIAQDVIELSSELNASTLISVGGIAEPDRLEIERPQVYVLSNDEEMLKAAINTGYPHPFENGYITGVKAAMIREAVKKNVKILVVLAQSHLNYPDPGASAEALSFLNRFLGLDVPVEPLLKQAEQLKLQLRDLMRRTASQLARLPKGLELEQAPGYIR